MLNRKQAPENNPLKPIKLLKPTSGKLKGGARLYIINGADADVIRIEFIFPRLPWDSAHRLTHTALTGMLLEGTTSRTAVDIAETIDFYGAFLNAESGADHSVVTLHSLSRHLVHTLPVVKDVLSASIFPEKELEIYQRNSRQRLQVNLEKNDFRARRAFNSAVFGSDSAHGYAAEPADFDHIHQDVLLAKYPQQFRSGNCLIVVSGNVGEDTVKLIEELFGSGDWLGDGESGSADVPEPLKEPGSIPSPEGSIAETHHVEMPGSVQSAIRLGKLMVTRDHPDRKSTRLNSSH